MEDILELFYISKSCQHMVYYGSAKHQIVKYKHVCVFNTINSQNSLTVVIQNMR